MTMELISPYDNRLNLISHELTVAELSKSAIKNIISDMKTIASGIPDEAHPNRKSMVGMSAPQIGELKNIILIDIAADPLVVNFKPNLKIFINPKIVEASDEENLGREGCFSTGEICGAVYRSNQVTISALDEDGREIIHKSTNLFQARIIQHEIDHLYGIRFPSRVRTTEHLHIVENDEFQDYRENWQNWKKYCPFEKWLEMYEGKN